MPVCITPALSGPAKMYNNFLSDMVCIGLTMVQRSHHMVIVFDSESVGRVALIISPDSYLDAPRLHLAKLYFMSWDCLVFHGIASVRHDLSKIYFYLKEVTSNVGGLYDLPEDIRSDIEWMPFAPCVGWTFLFQHNQAVKGFETDVSQYYGGARPTSLEGCMVPV